MPTRAEWLALAERIEAAAGADRGIDSTIHAMLGRDGWTLGEWDACVRRCGSPDQPTPEIPRASPYTASLDAAASLVPEGWRWWVNWQHARCWKGWRVEDDRDAADNDAWISVNGGPATPALALAAAACRARAEDADA